MKYLTFMETLFLEFYSGERVFPLSHYEKVEQSVCSMLQWYTGERWEVSQYVVGEVYEYTYNLR